MIIKIDPMGAPRMTQATYWKHKKYFDYKDAIRLLLPGYELGMSVHLIFHIKMPKSYPKKKRDELRGTYHDQKPDIDNLAKGFMDIWGSDDKHVAILRAEKYWADEGSIEIL